MATTTIPLCPTGKSRRVVGTVRPFDGVELPYAVIEGKTPGPCLLITAGVHGAEVDGIETARRIFANMPPEQINGTPVVLPTLNMQGLKQHIIFVMPEDGENLSELSATDADGWNSIGMLVAPVEEPPKAPLAVTAKSLAASCRSSSQQLHPFLTSAMANTTLEDPLAGDSPLESILATSSTEPILPIASTDWRSIWASAMTPSVSNQTISTHGVSGNARVVNVGGDYITHNNDGLGPETHAVLESIEQRLKVVHDKELDKEVDGWLAAPDVSQNLNAAIRKRQPGTGDWFLDGTEFAEWKESSKLLLCIYGAPGCGKTVLCSTIIEAVKDLCKTRLSGWAYFFFDSRNANKGLQLYENFLRSILSQLSSRCGGTPEAVKMMYQAHGSGKEQPSVKALEETLRQVIGAFDDVYIMVDSLDESGDRNDLLKWVETLARWNSAKWHLLTTSRSEPDIKSHLERIHNIRIVHLQGTTLDKDISIFLDEQLSLIICWSESMRALIKATLLEGADGMFRWVAMQIDSLQTCMNAKEVKEKLKALPKGLEETYELILTSSARRDDLLQMLHWLAFSTRALRLEEIAEVATVDFDAADGPCYEPDLKYANSRIALTVCSGLITETDGFVKLAHFSVKEYLISDRIKTGIAAHFSINRRLSHSVIAQTCAAYLLIFNQSDALEIPGGTSDRFPLHLYAARNLPEHLRLMENKYCPALHELLLKLFIPAPPYKYALANWELTHDFNKHNWNDGKVVPPIYYASFLGLRDVVESILEDGADVDLKGGWYGSALVAAAANNHTETAKLLLGSGADVDLQGGYYGCALATAAANGHTEMAKLLLGRGADVDNEGTIGRTALLVAAETGHINIAKILLEHGADIEFPDTSSFGSAATALVLAIENGQTEMVQLLLGCGANANIQAGKYETVFQAAAYGGHADIVKVLFEHGADVNTQGGEYGNALQAAAYGGHTGIVLMLLERGADVNILGGKYGNALQAGAYGGHTGIVLMLLEHDADANMQGGEYGNALQAAAYSGHTEVVKIVLEHGGAVNIRGGEYGTALQAAATNKDTETVKMLLEHGADINIQGGEYGTALQAAAYSGHTEVVKMLLKHGGAVNIQGGEYGTASQAAAYKGHTGIIKILLEHGADINIQGGEYGTALQAAAHQWNAEVVKMLLEHGADVNIQGGRYRNALQAAAGQWNGEVAKMLLEYYPDVNIQGGEYGTALQAAAESEGDAEVVQLLLEHGADVNIRGGEYGAAFQEAAHQSNTEVVKILLDHGADVNIQRGHYRNALQAAVTEWNAEVAKILRQYLGRVCLILSAICKSSGGSGE